MSDEKKPMMFSSFFDSVMAQMRAARGKRESDAIKRTMASDERIVELSNRVTRGNEAKRFVEGDFWIDYLQPFLRSEAVLKPATLKDGDPAPAERVMHEFLIGSGKVHVLARLVSRLEAWQSEGAEAEKVLELEAEKRKRLVGG